MKKKIVSVILVMCIVLSSFAVIGTATVSANAFGEFWLDRLFEGGCRVIAGSIELTSEATIKDDEDSQKVISLITSMLFGSAAERKTDQVKEMCEEILEKLDDIQKEISQSTAEITSMISNENYDILTQNLSEQINTDTNNIISNEHTDILDATKVYLEYMNEAEIYSNDKSDQNLQKLNNAKENLKGSFPLIDRSKGDKGQYNVNSNNMFTTSFIATALESSLVALINKLSPDSIGSLTIMDQAAKVASNVYPQSYQQYSYIMLFVQQQLTAITNTMLLYNEFLAEQYDYLTENGYAKSSPEWGYYNTAVEGYNRVQPMMAEATAKMLERKMNISPNLKLTLNDYVKPEDVVQIITPDANNSDTSKENNKIVYRQNAMETNGFLSTYTYTSAQLQGDDQTVTTVPKYSKNHMLYNNYIIMSDKTGKNTVYSVLDQNQFSDKSAIETKSLVFKFNRRGGPDFHLPTCDYLNYTMPFSDGINSFKVVDNSAKDEEGDVHDLDKLFDTSAFSSSESKPYNYFANYFTGTNKYIMTGQYRQGDLFTTSYMHPYFIDTYDTAAPLPAKTKELELNAGNANNEEFALIADNQSSEYKQNLQVKKEGGGSADIKISSPAANPVQCGDMVTIKFKPTSENSALTSLKLVRNFDPQAYISSTNTSETVLLSHDDFDYMEKDADGYYTFDCPMPYVDSTFVLETAVNRDINVVYGENADANLTVDGGNIHFAGETVNFTVSGHYDSVSCNGTPITIVDGKGSFTMPDSDVTLKVDAERGDYKVNVKYDENCEHNLTLSRASGYYDAGETVTFSLSSDAVSVTLDGNEINVENGKGSFIMPNNDAELYVKESKPLGDRNLNISNPCEGPLDVTIYVNGNPYHDGESAVIHAGDSVTVQAKTTKFLPLQIYLKSNGDFTKLNTEMSFENIYKIFNTSFVMPNDDSEIVTALDDKNQNHKISVVNDGLGGDITLEIPQKDYTTEKIPYANPGDVINITANDMVDKVTLNGKDITLNDGKASFTMPDFDVVLNVTTKIENHTVNIIDMTGGRAELSLINENNEFSTGENVKFKVSGDYIGVYKVEKAITKDDLAIKDDTAKEESERTSYHYTDDEMVPVNSDRGYFTMDNNDVTLVVAGFQKDTDGNYIINTYDDFVLLSKVVENKNEIENFEKYASAGYILNNNIDAQGTTFTSPIGAVKEISRNTDEEGKFNGKFDGNGHIIYNMSINVDSSDVNTAAGLFGFIGTNGIVKNLSIFKSTLNANSQFCGMIAGNNAGTINNCTSGTDVTSFKFMGDTINKNLNNTINIKTENAKPIAAGGVCGFSSGTIVNCASAAEINSEAMYVGGLLGQTANGRVINSYSNSPVIKGDYNGNLIGWCISSQIFNVYSGSTEEGCSLIGGTDGQNHYCCTYGLTENSGFTSSDMANHGIEAYTRLNEDILNGTAEMEAEYHFVDILNANVKSNIIDLNGIKSWLQSSDKNKGRPYIVSGSMRSEREMPVETLYSIYGYTEAADVKADNTDVKPINPENTVTQVENQTSLSQATPQTVYETTSNGTAAVQTGQGTETLALAVIMLIGSAAVMMNLLRKREK